MASNHDTHTRDIRPKVPGCELLGPYPTSEQIFDLYREVYPGDPFAPQYLRDAAARLGTRQAVVVVWPDGVAAILHGAPTRQDVVQAYWDAVNRFARSAGEPSTSEVPTTVARKKRRYTKRKDTSTAPAEESNDQ